MNPTIEDIMLAFGAMREAAHVECERNPALGIAINERIARARMLWPVCRSRKAEGS